MYNYYTNATEIVPDDDGLEKVKSRFFFFMASPPVTGGDLVLVEHARELIKAGVDARILFFPNESFGHLHSDFPPEIPINLLNDELILTPSDFIIVGESQGPVYRDMRHWMDKEIHTLPKFIVFNQAVHWTAYSFKNRQEFNSLHFAGLLCASPFVKKYLEQVLGFELNKVFKAVHVVCPATEIPQHILALPSSEQRSNLAKPPKCTISFIHNLRKRADEINTLKFMFLSLYPEYADKVEFIAIHKKTHEQTLEIMRNSDIFIASGYMDSHNLPAIEAMACGCHVLGYTGLSMPVDYFNANNGWWFIQEGQFQTNIQLLKQAIDLYFDQSSQGRSLRKHLLTQAQETVQTLFSPQSENTKIVPAYLDIWEKTVAPYYATDVVFASKKKGGFKK
ncbi:glycosyltransferase [Psittacicella gerlachiana]|uniref:Glycosyl transferase family 1 domain-containing protein n=1 Tax=Psittacicella gerlachiana TaxID=2028574 RepID=A0A3A1YD61_9GAMM|nr:glycosyltransferase [Psittacicella gerlachiana]RIY35605.1 hypothetical protein CKF59_03410 [Psittacicella gerlachiana]